MIKVEHPDPQLEWWKERARTYGALVKAFEGPAGRALVDGVRKTEDEIFSRVVGGQGENEMGVIACGTRPLRLYRSRGIVRAEIAALTRKINELKWEIWFQRLSQGQREQLLVMLGR